MANPYVRHILQKTFEGSLLKLPPTHLMHFVQLSLFVCLSNFFFISTKLLFQDDLFQTFGGPWADTPCRPQDIDFHVPHEYLTNTTIR